MPHHRDHSPWKDFAAGVLGGIAGVAAMNYYVELTTKLGAPSLMQPPKQAEHDMSLVGRQYREGESATGALGRLLYQKVTGREPDEDTKSKLSYAIHWGYGKMMGGFYGLARGRAGSIDLAGGLAFGAVLWAIGDELGVPLLGLAEGPKAYPATFHAQAVGAHLVYGLAAAATTQLIKRALD